MEFKITYKPRLEQRLLLRHKLHLDTTHLERNHCVYGEVGLAPTKTGNSVLSKPYKIKSNLKADGTKISAYFMYELRE
jgi:hypothetical protein